MRPQSGSFGTNRAMRIPRNTTSVCVSLAAILSFSSCKKDGPPPPVGEVPAPVTLRLFHLVDGAPVQYDTMAYTNEAGNTYSITHLEYYLSELVLIGSGTSPNDTLNGPWLVDANGGTEFETDRVKAGTYSGAKVLIGLPPALNITGALPNTIANIHMAWPDLMGGGYHFIKFEGHFTGSSGLSGFAMHVGNNEFLAECNMPGSFTTNGNGGTIELRFNLNEVFRTPHVYDLDSGNYSMGNMVLMGRLRDNCADALAFQYLP